MIVVSDTTPIHYLILIGKDSLLPILFAEVVIPDVVLMEMSHPNAPESVRKWANDPPAWVARRTSVSGLLSDIKGVGTGESSAIAIAVELAADAVLMDDRKAIREATRRGLNVLTTFALLEIASRKDLVDFAAAVDALSKTNFHFPPKEIVDDFIRRNASSADASGDTK